MHSIHATITRTAVRARWALSSLLPLVVCAAAQAAPVVDANVVNTPKVIDAENPARSAFAATLCAGNCDAGTTAMTVPAGKVAVVEFMSASCIGTDAPNFTINTLQLTVALKGARFTHFFPVRTTGAVNGIKFYAASQAMRAYADATSGGTIQASYSSINGDTNAPTCSFTLSGYLLNQ
jgi:hypothetical protein